MAAVPGTRLSIIRCATLTMPTNLIYDASYMTAQEAASLPENIDGPVYGVLIQHPQGNILFDTGIQGYDRERLGDFFYTTTFWDNDDKSAFLTNLSKIVSPDEIDYVVISHLHCDHTGFLDKFTNAQVYVAQNEFTQICKNLLAPGEGVSGIVTFTRDITAWMQAGLKWNMVGDGKEDLHKETELVDGVYMVPFGPGHSHGMLALLVELTKTGNIILCGDLVHTLKNFGPPAVPNQSAICADAQGYRDSIEYLRQLAEQRNAQLWASHDIEQFKTFKTSDEGYYE